MATNLEQLLPPGYRFHPTDEELVIHYLRKQVACVPCPASIIAEVDVYKYDPWDLPAQAAFGDDEWYFFSPRERKYPNGVRPNRAAASGYWKATGTDKAIVGGGGRERIGVKKALVFYKGRPPKGLKTDWIMHEYRLVERTNAPQPPGLPKTPKDICKNMRLDDCVLCRIYNKSNHVPSSPPADGSVSEDAHFPPVNAAAAAAVQDGAKLPKSYSVSDLFDEADVSALTPLFHERPLDVAAPDLLGLLPGLPSLNPPFIPGDAAAAGFYLPKLAPVESPAPAAGDWLKRQREAAACSYGEGGGGGALSHPSKRYNSSGQNHSAVDAGHVDAAPEFSMLSQPLLLQRLLSNPRWGFQ